MTTRNRPLFGHAWKENTRSAHKHTPPVLKSTSFFWFGNLAMIVYHRRQQHRNQKYTCSSAAVFIPHPTDTDKCPPTRSRIDGPLPWPRVSDHGIFNSSPRRNEPPRAPGVPARHRTTEHACSGTHAVRIAAQVSEAGNQLAGLTRPTHLTDWVRFEHFTWRDMTIQKERLMEIDGVIAVCLAI